MCIYVLTLTSLVDPVVTRSRRALVLELRAGRDGGGRVTEVPQRPAVELASLGRAVCSPSHRTVCTPSSCSDRARGPFLLPGSSHTFVLWVLCGLKP